MKRWNGKIWFPSSAISICLLYVLLQITYYSLLFLFRLLAVKKEISWKRAYSVMVEAVQGAMMQTYNSKLMVNEFFPPWSSAPLIIFHEDSKKTSYKEQELVLFFHFSVLCVSQVNGTRLNWVINFTEHTIVSLLLGLSNTVHYLELDDSKESLEICLIKSFIF